MKLSDLKPGDWFLFDDDRAASPHMVIIEWFKRDGRLGIVEISTGRVSTFDPDSPFWRQAVTPIEKAVWKKCA